VVVDDLVAGAMVAGVLVAVRAVDWWVAGAG